MRLNRRVPIGTHGGVRGRLSYLFRGVSYSIALLRMLKGGGRLDCQQLTPIFAGRLHPQPVYFVAAKAEKVRSI